MVYIGDPYRKCKLRKTSIIFVTNYGKDCLLLYVPLENIYSPIIRSHHCCCGATMIRCRPMVCILNCKALYRRGYLSYLNSSITTCRLLKDSPNLVTFHKQGVLRIYSNPNPYGIFLKKSTHHLYFTIIHYGGDF